MQKNILIIEPFYKGSHKYWVDSLKEYSTHNIDITTQNGVFWKWRVQQSAFEFRLPKNHNYDIILSSNMHNLSTWAGINRKELSKTQLVHYFHENQLNYPGVTLSDQMNFGFKNILDALCADKVVFNSNYHLSLFIETFKRLNKNLRDKISDSDIQTLEEKSLVLPIGLKTDIINKYAKKVHNDVPLILWNHRWEEDKNPKLFFDTLLALSKKDIAFELCVLGKSPKVVPSIFLEAKEKLKDKIVHWGAVESFEKYIEWLWRADILPVTSNHDFFGISVLEAALCENALLLPQRNAYPDHFSPKTYPYIYFESDTQFQVKLESMLRNNLSKYIVDRKTLNFSWNAIIREYDEFFKNINHLD